MGQFHRFSTPVSSFVTLGFMRPGRSDLSEKDSGPTDSADVDPLELGSSPHYPMCGILYKRDVAATTSRWSDRFGHTLGHTL